MKSAALALAFTVASLFAGPSSGSAQSPDTLENRWWSRISAGGDLRVRMESFTQKDAPDRLRSRFRLRASAAAAINDEVQVGVRLVSGNPFDPITANQTFTDWSVRKPITIDRAYVTYRPSALQMLQLGAGKFEFPIRMTNLIFDDNLNWEGAYEQLSTRDSRPLTARLTAVQSPMNEQSRGRDSYLFVESGQVSLERKAYRLGIAVSSFRFTNPDPLAVAIADERLDARNTNRLVENAAGSITGFASDFNLIDVIADATLSTGRKDYPVQLTADFVRNFAAVSDQDHGLWVEAQYGAAEKPGTWSLGYTFSRIEEDAVLSPFLFDDMLGTNAKMHLATASYVPLRNVNVDLTFLFGKWLSPAPGDNPNLLTRIQLSVRAHL